MDPRIKLVIGVAVRTSVPSIAVFVLARTVSKHNNRYSNQRAAAYSYSRTPVSATNIYPMGLVPGVLGCVQYKPAYLFPTATTSANLAD